MADVRIIIGVCRPKDALQGRLRKLRNRMRKWTTPDKRIFIFAVEAHNNIIEYPRKIRLFGESRPAPRQGF